MIPFNIPPYVGKELEYIKEAMEKNHKICGDGPFTKRCNEWLEKRFNVEKVLLTTSCTHATEMAAILADIKEGDEVATSGLGAYNAENIPVGKVLSVSEAKDQLNKIVLVKPAADLSDIRAVMLVGN